MIVNFFKTHKRIPTKRDFYSYWQAYRKLFGTWNRAIIKAGFAPNPVRFARKVAASDGHICDSFAEKIIDNWLNSKGILHEHGVYYPNQKKYKTDFFINKKYWIEFIGMKGQLKAYDINYKRKMRILKGKGIKITEVYPKDLFPDNKLAFRLAFLLK